MYIVISGGGKVGEYLASVLLQSDNDVAIIEADLATADRLSVALQGRYLVIHGDGCDSKYQEDAGIRRADVFVATTGRDDNNLVSCEIAQRVFNVPRCIARVNSPKNLRIFKEVGIESVSSTTLIANLIEEETLMGSVSVASSLTHGNVMLSEVVVPRMRHHSNDAGLRAMDIPMPENSLIAAVSPKNDDNVEVTGPDTVLYPGDKAIVVADVEVLDEVRALFKAL
ncbi:TrkA family potassium uptake protein [Eggerthella sp. YY7918]|uniref:potassium channel family protein n=1 Tax=Eggerthella sp. (strain YY7918) TaxID=502558 RepID=UPI0002170EB0|nr:TrkA family potassium uptake protein [Eggerthella sp. YY7918]BAK43602.1 K+ transport system, NAD-binding component [Eggerthella sp. YY7918]